MPSSTSNKNSTFGRLLRFWRTTHALSQQELAEAINSSTRHINRLENNHVHPSEVLVIAIIEKLNLKYRDSDQLLTAAGYKPQPHSVDYHNTELKWFRKATARTLIALEPNPSILVDSHNNILMMNKAWLGLSMHLPEETNFLQINNYVDFLFFHVGPSSETESWKNVRSMILMALQQETVFHEDINNQRRLSKLLASPLTPKDWKQRAATLDPLTSFRVPITMGEKVTFFYNVMLNVAPIATVSYMQEPRLAINTLYPEDDNAELSHLSQHELQHPLLY